MNSKVVEIRRVIRRMRGGSQSFLIEGADGHAYVAKWTANPQGTRTLLNEWIAHRLLQKLEICTPQMRILRLSGPLCAASKDLYFDVDPKRFIEPGLHLGSRCPVNPETTAIFDFLPAKLLNQITNRGDFVKCLVLDTLIGQWDKRQAVFVRDRVSKSRPACRAYLIDHGMSFGGSHWEQLGQRTTGIYLDYSVYRSPDVAPVWI